MVQRKLAQRVQRRERSAVTASPEQLHETAASGLTGAAQQLPHRDTIQASFGRHDVGGVQAFVGGPAAAASDRMGASAYAVGDSVAFGGSPDLHTAAHEAAHVVQQRGGVQLRGGVGEVGDVYERNADAVADSVVGGRSAEPLLDELAGGAGAGSRGALQKQESDIYIPPVPRAEETRAQPAMDPAVALERAQKSLDSVELAGLAKLPYAEVVLAVAKNPYTGAAALDDPLSFGDAPVRAAVAAHSSVEGKTLQRMIAPYPEMKWSTEGNLEVRLAAAKNRKLPPPAQAVLGRDTEASVREAVAANTATAPSVVDGMMKSPDDDVRASLAVATATSEVHKHLAANEQSLPVVVALAKNTGIADSVLGDVYKKWGGHDEVAAAVAANQQANATLLAVVADHPSLEIARLVVRHRNCPPDAFKKIVPRAADAEIDRTVAAHGSADAATLEMLANGTADVEAQRLIAKHASSGAAALETLARRTVDVDALGSIAGHAKAPPTLLASLAWHPDASVQAGVLLNDRTDSVGMDALAQSATPRIRLGAVNDSKTTPATLRRVANNPVELQFIRDAAKEQLKLRNLAP